MISLFLSFICRIICTIFVSIIFVISALFRGLLFSHLSALLMRVNRFCIMCVICVDYFGYFVLSVSIIFLFVSSVSFSTVSSASCQPQVSYILTVSLTSSSLFVFRMLLKPRCCVTSQLVW